MTENIYRRDSSTLDGDSLANLAAQIETLESRAAHQEHWLEQLDEAVASQERRLQELLRVNTLIHRRLREQQQALDDSADGFDPARELPPHY